MKAKSFFLVVTATILAVLIGIGMRQARLIRAAEAELGVFDGWRAREKIELQHSVERFGRAEQERVARQTQLDALRRPKETAFVGVDSTEAVGKTGTRPTGDPLDEMDKRWNDPVVQKLMLAARRAELASRYAPFFRLRGMLSAQIDAFLDTELKAQADSEDLMAVMRAQGLSLGDPTTGKLRDEIGARHLPAQRELLGEVGFREWQEFESTMGTRMTVSQWAGEATMAGIAITPQQAEQLIQTIASARREEGKERGIRETNWERVEGEARFIFSPAQLEFFAARMRLGALGEKVGKLQHDAEEAEEARKAEAKIAPAAKAPGG